MDDQQPHRPGLSIPRCQGNEMKPQCNPTARPRMVNIVIKTREETEPPDSHPSLDETENGTITLEKLGHKIKYPPTPHIYPREIKVWVQKSMQEYL